MRRAFSSGGGRRGGGGGYNWRKHVVRGGGGGRGRANNNNNRKNNNQQQPDPQRTEEQLTQDLIRINGSSYGAYKDLRGSYHLNNGMILFIDHVQSDPYAAPSSLRIRVPMTMAKFPQDSYQQQQPSSSSLPNDIRNIALCDYVTRLFYKICAEKQYTVAVKSNTFSHGKGGDIRINKPSQHIVQRSSMVINNEYVEARCKVGLPARGRTILGEWCLNILTQNLVYVATNSMLLDNVKDVNDMWNHIHCAEDQDYLRNSLSKHGLIGFIRNNAILPRISGVNDKPMDRNNAIPFQSPPSYEISLETPNSGIIKGMGIKKGVTLIVGGGFHGKSTLLQTLEKACYNFIPGDGREMCVCDKSTAKIRAEDGRMINSVNISAFIDNLPLGKNTKDFMSLDASGSTSQAANIIEALEAGTSTLLIDEDTSATNFMIRDQRMQELVTKDKEPISPFVSKVRLLYNDYGCSSVLVIGGCGDYFNVADNVIMMNSYLPQDVTAKAKEITLKYPANLPEEEKHFGDIDTRHVIIESFRKGGDRTRVRSMHTIAVNNGLIDLACLEQLIEESQTHLLSDLIEYMHRNYTGSVAISAILNDLENVFNTKGIDAIAMNQWNRIGSYTRPRRIEIAATLNRMRFLKFKILSK